MSLPIPHPCSGFTSIAAFLLTREVWNSRAGLLAACFIAIVPGYISRSVAGSYDNEGIAIFALLFTYFLWLKSVKTGSVFWATAAALSYFYMVGAGGVWSVRYSVYPKNSTNVMGKCLNLLDNGYFFNGGHFV